MPAALGMGRLINDCILNEEGDTAAPVGLSRIVHSLKGMMDMGLVSRQRNVDEVIVGAIDEALLVIGEPAKKILYYHIENKYLLKPEDIPKKPELFIVALKSLLGAGGVYIESLILKKVCKELGVPYESLKSSQFEDALKEIRQNIN